MPLQLEILIPNNIMQERDYPRSRQTVDKPGASVRRASRTRPDPCRNAAALAGRLSPARRNKRAGNARLIERDRAAKGRPQSFGCTRLPASARYTRAGKKRAGLKIQTPQRAGAAPTAREKAAGQSPWEGSLDRLAEARESAHICPRARRLIGARENRPRRRCGRRADRSRCGNRRPRM